jgi:hypothetical protein
MRAAVALACLFLLGIAPAPSPLPLDPDAIFRAARTAWGQAGYAHYTRYVVEIAFRNGAKHLHRHYTTYEDMRHDAVFADERSREERADPGNFGWGTNVSIFGLTINQKQPEDPIGAPALAIDYDFGIAPVPHHADVLRSGATMTYDTSLAVIGSTKTESRDYDVRLIETLDDGTFHLGLTPLRKPEINRLRELWVEPKTYRTTKALVASNFNRKPLTNVAWLIEFTTIDGAPYVWRETAQDVLDFGKAGTLDHVQVTFEDITPIEQLPWTLGIGFSSKPLVTEP